MAAIPKWYPCKVDKVGKFDRNHPPRARGQDIVAPFEHDLPFPEIGGVKLSIPSHGHSPSHSHIVYATAKSTEGTGQVVEVSPW